MNGVCVLWRGWIELSRLDGIGSLEYDAERAEVEQTLLREQIEQYNRRLREFEERQRQYRQDQERQAESEAESLQQQQHHQQQQQQQQQQRCSNQSPSDTSHQ